MNKFTLTVLGATLSLTAFAQSIEQTPIKAVPSNHVSPSVHGEVVKSSKATKSVKALGATYFNETFSNGLAGDASNGVWTTNGNSNGTANPNAVWEYRGTTTTPDITVGSRGAYVGTRGPIVSPSASNGFFIFDSDFLDNGGSAGAQGAGIAPTPHESWLISPVFSTVGATDLVLNLSATWRRFQGDGYILLSNDGGTTWGDSITLFDPDFGVNLAVNEDNVVFEKAGFLDNSANARIALFFDGITSFNTFGSGYYYWMVDDIVVQENADNNLVYESTYLQTGYDTGIIAYYTWLPNSQSGYDSIQLSANFSNDGKIDQPNAKITANIGLPTGPVSYQSTPIISAAGTSDSVFLTDWLTFDKGIGAYSWEMNISSDSTEDVPENNTADSVFVNVNDSTYGRDYNAFGSYWYGAGSTFEIGPMFDIYDSAKATSVSINHSATSVDGGIFSIYLYDANFNQIASREFIEIDSTQNGTYVAYKIPETILAPGQYIVTYRTYADDVFFRISPTDADPQTVFVQIDGDGTWYYSTRLPSVRLNISEDLVVCDVVAQAYQTGNNAAATSVTGGTAPYSYLWSTGATTDAISGVPSEMNYTVVVTDDNNCVSNTASVYVVTGVEDLNALEGVSVFPNPSNGMFNINFNNVTERLHTIKVTNTAGSIVYFKEVGQGFSGNLEVKMTDITAGVYIVHVEDGSGDSGVYKLIVQ